MQTLDKDFEMLYRLILIAILGLSLVACNRDVSIRPNGDGTATIVVSLSEQEVNTIVTSALNNASNPILENATIDLQNGRIVVNGDYNRQNGQGTVAGSLTLAISASNGNIQAEITAVDIDGWNASDERIEQFNANLENRLSSRASQNNSGATLDSISITEDAMEIAIRVSIPINQER